MLAILETWLVVFCFVVIPWEAFNPVVTGFKSRSDRLLDSFLGPSELTSSYMLVNSRLVASCQPGF